MIAMQVIERIKHVHECNYVHRDIKPDNFLVGKGETENTIYILDFGLAKRYRDEHTHIHIPLKENRNLTGTARYASCNAHNGLEQSRRDDMESIGYVLIYFLKKTLPWKGLKCKDKNEKYQKIKELKMSTTPEKLCEGLPNEFAKYLTMVKRLGFEEEPEYKKYINMFNELFKANDYEKDYIYDWITVKNNTKLLKDVSICRSQENSKDQGGVPEKKGEINVDSTIKDNGNNQSSQQGEQQGQKMRKQLQGYNNNEEDGEEDIKRPKGNYKGPGKGGKNEKCTVF